MFVAWKCVTQAEWVHAKLLTCILVLQVHVDALEHVTMKKTTNTIVECTVKLVLEQKSA